MASPELAEGEMETGGLVAGGFTDYRVTGFDPGRRSYRTQDQPVPRGDGRLMGRDELEPRALQGSITCRAPGDPGRARELERQLAAAWSGDQVRRTPGGNTSLRIRPVGSAETRRVFGRPRNYSVDETEAVFGFLRATAQFAAVDSLFYADDPVGLSLDIVTTQDTGLAGPWQDPLADAGVGSSRPGIVDVPGLVPTPHIEVAFDGPVTHPGFEIVGVGTITVRVELLSGQRVELGLHPSMRRARRNPGGSVAGKLAGANLEDMWLPPGLQEVRYHGLDTTASSSMSFTAYPAFPSP